MFTKKQFLREATAKIPGKREREMVRLELEGHLEDRMEILLDRGVDEKTAEALAVEGMGDVNILADEMGRLHPYDTGKAYHDMVGLLWLGLMLPWVPVGTPTWVHPVLEIISILLLIYSLFHLQKLQIHLRYAAWLAFGMGVVHSFAWSASVLPVAGIRSVGSNVLFLLKNLLQLVMIWELGSGLSEISEKVEVPMKFYFGLNTILFAGQILLLLTGVGSLELPGLFVFPLLAAVIFLFYWSWKVRKLLDEEEDLGIEPCPKTHLAGLSCILLILTIFPLLVSSFYYPVTMAFAKKTAVEIEENEKNVVMEKLIVDGKAYTALTKEEQESVTCYLAAVPAEEWKRLTGAKRVELVWRELYKSNPEQKFFFLQAELENQVLIAELTRWEKEEVKYEVVNSFALYQSEDITVWGVPFQHAAWEKAGKVYEISGGASFLANEMGIGAVECRMDREADAVLIYQSLMIPKSQWTERLCIFAERSIRKFPWRIPYQEVKIGGNDVAAHDGIIWGMMMDNQEPLQFVPGIARNIDTWTWERRGGFFYNIE